MHAHICMHIIVHMYIYIYYIILHWECNFSPFLKYYDRPTKATDVTLPKFMKRGKVNQTSVTRSDICSIRSHLTDGQSNHEM